MGRHRSDPFEVEVYFYAVQRGWVSLLRRVTFVDCHKSNQKDALSTAHLESENPICGGKSDFRLRHAYNNTPAKAPSQSDKSASCSLLGMCLSQCFM